MSGSDEQVLAQPPQHQLLSAFYYQQSSKAPIFNGDIEGNVINDFHISTLDGQSTLVLWP
jgi:hypothetical protein